MSQSIDIQELAIVVTAQHHNPAILNPEFLKCSGVIPADWELARAPVCNPQVAQVVFRNGISITAQADRILFVESMGAKAPQEVEATRVARQYVQTLPHADYQALGINFKGFVPFHQDTNAAHRFLTNTLLSPGAWQAYGQETVKASINLVYTLERGRLYLSISEAALQLPDGVITPIVMFLGNFEYRSTEESGDSTTYLQNCLNHWQVDLENFKDLINARFLADRVSTQSLDEPVVTALSTPELLTIGA